MRNFPRSFKEFYNGVAQNQMNFTGGNSNPSPYLEQFNGSMIPMNIHHPGQLTMQSPVANWPTLPQQNGIKFLGHQVQNQGNQSNWRKQSGIGTMRTLVRNIIEEKFMLLPNSLKLEENRTKSIIDSLEDIRYMESSSLEEYTNMDSKPLSIWIVMTMERMPQYFNKAPCYSSETGAFGDRLEVARSNMQIADASTLSFRSFSNYCSPVGQSNYQQEDRYQHFQQHPTQGMLSHSSRSGQLAAGGSSRLVTWENPDQQFQQQQTQSSLSHFNFNGELATNGSGGYFGEVAIASDSTTSYYNPADCFQYQQQDFDLRIEQCNGMAYHETLKHFPRCQGATCTCGVGMKIGGTVTSNLGSAMPNSGTRRTRDDGNVGGCTGGTLEDIVFPPKRQKIDDPSAPPDLGYGTARDWASPQVPQMFQHPMYDPFNSLSYGYETVQERAPIDRPLSPKGLPQMHRGDDIEETLKHQKTDDPSVSLFSEYETQGWGPIDLPPSPQGLPAMHQHPYVPVSDGSNVTEELFASFTQNSPKSISIGNEDPEDCPEMKLDWDSGISLEIIDSSEDEGIVANILNQVKTEAEHITAVDHVAGSVSETSNKNVIHSVTPEKIKEPVMNGILDFQNFSEVKLDHPEDSPQVKLYGDIVPSEDKLMTSSNQEILHVETSIRLAEPEVVQSKSDKSKIKGASLTELFTPEQIKEHITSLRLRFGESKAKVEKKLAMEDSTNDQPCQLCSLFELSFEAPNCSLCGWHLKQNCKYFTAFEGDTKYFFCTKCYNVTKGERITISGLHIDKAKLEKMKGCEDVEPWVQCDKCNSWQHQICALFNSKRNEEEKAEYICPNCYIQEIEIGQRMPLPQSAILGAKDLRRTKLSDFIEGRLFRRLKEEREDRAKIEGKNFNEVPGVEDLVVRVVLSADKTLQVKQKFLDVFKEENYPKEFPYRAKVILLFQKIEGVEVCLFGMYVQEFGSECAPPNQRSVYISYLDSVKFLRPDIKSATGGTLRTFVYHEILVGYLDYCKKRGFNRCYIWSCPPSKQDDYIFYCHPVIQKTLKPEHLREWYHAMLRKASSEKIIVNVTNLYEDFFVPHGECKVTATRLPYFDGDYWPRAAEDMLKNLVEEDGVKSRRKQKKPKSRRCQEASGCTDCSGTSMTDILLMQELGKSISKTKENFIVVKLESEHMALDTENEDEIIETKIFDSRETFLRFCETKHYQFDTLRRAKHSSMMLLYHLHNPSG